MMRSPKAEEVVKEIAADTRTPEDVVEKMYDEIWQAYSKDARITDYMQLLVAKRVRDSLRSRERAPR
jgi:hypothetical protein